MYPENNPYFVPQPQNPVYPPEAKKEPKYKPVDSVFAWLSLLFAFLFCQTVPVTRHPLGGFLLILTLFITVFIVLKIKKIKLLPVCTLTAISAGVISASLLLTESPFLVRLAYTYSLVCYCYYLYAALGNRVENGFSDFIYIDLLKILFILPFCSLAALFPAIFSDSTKRGSRLMLKIIIGIAITIIPTSLVLGFLSYDDGFMKILKGIFAIESDEVAHLIFSLMFSLPLAMYGFGLYASSGKNILQDRMTAENCKNALQKTKILPQLTAVVAVIPILFLYVVFFISQWKYYVSGFTGVLPEGFSYAEYARQGFFELCSVSVVNLVILVSIAFFIKRGAANKAVILKIITLLFSLATLILICTAVAKLVMYIDYYGLTQKRIYAMWLMALIAVIFLIIALGQFIPKMKIVALSATVAVIMFTGLSLCNVSAITSHCNVDRFLSGSLETLDTELLDELDDSAIPALVRAAKEMDAQKHPELKVAIDVILAEKAVELRDEKFSVFAWNVPSVLAKSAMKEYTPQIPPAGKYGLSSMSLRGDSIFYGEGMYSNYLTIRGDGTGSFYYNGEEKAVVVELDALVIDGETYELRYTPAEDENNASIRLVWEDETEFVSMILYSY